MILWRISNYADLDGFGGVLASGRWHNAGTPVVYCALHPATALVERLVHQDIGPSGLPDTYRFLKIEVPSGVARTVLPPLPSGWQADEAYTRSIGDGWLASGMTALLVVPKVIVPETENILLNPRHGDAATIRITAEIAFPLDKRLLKAAAA